MSSIVFDTHAFVKRLTAAGMPLQQAEILAEEQARLIDERRVTRAYLDERIKALEYRLTLRLGG
ncbi:MAG: CCDC90 family protein [Thiobacillaceae bacterium]|nr:CCDC90 family protein [Thiobacillaceae bacterium]MCX7673252.1 CCDC90 family protein [Thiobacillaceae bacterium]